MKRFLLLALFFANISAIYAQEISIKPEMNETNFEQTLRSFEGYTYYNFMFVSNKDAALNFEIVEKEFVNGKLEKEKVYFDSKVIPTAQKGNTVPVSILAKGISDNIYKQLFRFYDFASLIREFDLKKEDQYAFKIFVNEAQKFTFDKTYLFSAIVKPIKIAENTYRDCDFAAYTDKYDQWYEIFGLDRYFVYEIKFYR